MFTPTMCSRGRRKVAYLAGGFVVAQFARFWLGFTQPTPNVLDKVYYTVLY